MSTVKELWDEYRISKQYEGVTGALADRGISDGTEEYMRPESKTTPERRVHGKRGKSIWVEMTDVPRWFLFELGYVKERW